MASGAMPWYPSRKDGRPLTTLLTAPKELVVDTLSEFLAGVDLTNPPAGQVDIDCLYLDFISPTGMAALLAIGEVLFKADSKRLIQFRASANDNVNAYMQRMGLFELIGVPELPLGRKRLRGQLCELSRVMSHREVDSVVPHLLEVAHKQLRLRAGVPEAMGLSLSEVAENSVDHAQTATPGIVCAQTYRKGREVEFAIVDTGIGILASASALPGWGDTTDRGAIQWAISQGTTSKPGPHTGYGLFMARRMIESNEGTMWVYSGRSAARITHRGVDLRATSPWPGTIVTLRFRTDRAISVKEVLEQDFGSEDATESVWG